MTSQMLGQGVYTFSEAARLTGLSVARVRAWFTGKRTQLGPVIRSDYFGIRKTGSLVSFLDLIDAFVVGHLRKQGFSLQYLRKVHEVLIQEFRTPHPFCQKNLLTDGKRIFLHVAYELDDEVLKDILTRQHAFPKVLRPYLRQVDYDPGTLRAKCWHISQGVVVDPQRQFGKPIVEAAGIPTAVLAAAYRANGEDPDLVGEWYGVDPEHVVLAVDFESRLHEAAA